MNSANNYAKDIKNCLLVFRNKKINNFDGANAIVNSFSSYGYYFEKISYISFSDSGEIIRSLKDGKENFGNLIIYCPYEMDKMLKDFISSLYAGNFNELGILKNENNFVFILYSDHDNRLRLEDIKNALENKLGFRYGKAYIRTVGASSALINKCISDALECEDDLNNSYSRNLEFNVNLRYGEAAIEIIYREDIPKNYFDKVYRRLLRSLDSYVYAVDNCNLAEKLYHLLKLRRMKISVAESFTGGGVSKKLVEISGISEVYFEGVNTYSNEAKMLRLGVKELTLMQYGAVSEQTAYEMAEGLLKSGNCDVSIATTGIAGPKSDNTLKPVGLLYIAVGTTENISVYKYNLKGDRDNITNTAINLALFLAYKKLK